MQKVRSLTSQGKDYQGKAFEKYSPSYERRKGGVVNLFVSGKMLGALRMSVNGKIYEASARGTSKEEARTMSVGIFDDQKQALKGAVHNEGVLLRGGSKRLGLRGSVRRIPKRRWLDATPATVREVGQIMADSRDARVKNTI